MAAAQSGREIGGPTMALIELEAALEICEKEYQERLRMLDYCGDIVAWNIGGAIKVLPTIDAVPVVHGKLKSTGMDEMYAEFGGCTVCGGDNYIKAKFCNWCGAKLDGGEGHETD